MDAKSFAKVGLRILAVYLIADGIVQTWDFLVGGPLAALGPITFAYMIFVLVFVSPLIAGLVLWVLAPYLANWVAGKDRGERLTVALDATALLEVGLIAIGFVLLCQALPDTFLSVYRILEWGTEHRSSEYMMLVAQIIRAVLGIFLILGAKPFTRLTYSLRQ